MRKRRAVLVGVATCVLAAAVPWRATYTPAAVFAADPVDIVMHISAGGHAEGTNWPSCGDIKDGRAGCGTVGGKGWVGISCRSADNRVASCADVFIAGHGDCPFLVYESRSSDKGPWEGRSERGEPGTQPEYGGFERQRHSKKDGVDGCNMHVRNWADFDRWYRFRHVSLGPLQ